MTDIRAAAEAIAAARRGRTPLAPLPVKAAPATEAEGYRIQDAVHDLLAADVGARVGYKIGCTSAVMQQYLNIPHPCGGGVAQRQPAPSLLAVAECGTGAPTSSRRATMNASARAGLTSGRLGSGTTDLEPTAA